MTYTTNAEIIPLLELSVQVGQNLLLTQASTGNTSVKLGGALWIKASGKWLADAMQDEIFIALDLGKVSRLIRQDRDPSGFYATGPDTSLRPSVETAMHAVLPHAVVVHVHSVNTIAWAVRADVPARLEEHLDGLCWEWIPYVPSGLPLAREIQKAVARSPSANVFVLGNHGLVVAGEDCEAASDLLNEVEQRLGTIPRRSPDPDYSVLERIAGDSLWNLPRDKALHAAATDPVSARILAGGLLYPCQAIFSTVNLSALFHPVPRRRTPEHYADLYRDRPFLIVEGCGIVVRDTITPTEDAMLSGLVRVVQRIKADAPLRYLSDADVSGLMLDSYRNGSAG